MSSVSPLENGWAMGPLSVSIRPFDGAVESVNKLNRAEECFVVDFNKVTADRLHKEEWK